MWKKFGKARQATNDNIIRRMRFACWIAKAAEAHSEYVIFNCFSPATVVTRSIAKAWGGKPVQITGTRRSGRGLERQLCCICLCLSRQYRYLSVVQINPLPTTPKSLCNSELVFPISSDIFARSAFAGWPEFFLPPPGPEPALSDPAWMHFSVTLICSYIARLFQSYMVQSVHPRT